MFQLLSRGFGLLNEECCDNCCGQTVSQVQSHIIYEINRQHNPSMQDVANALGMDITTFSRQVKTLVDRGLVNKTPDPNDNRFNILSLTPEGQFMENDINERVNEQLNKILSHLSDFERESVIRSFKLMIDAMQKSNTCCIPSK
jgi:DNA-binding MarR family transcriptional regulator